MSDRVCRNFRGIRNCVFCGNTKSYHDVFSLQYLNQLVLINQLKKGSTWIHCGRDNMVLTVPKFWDLGVSPETPKSSLDVQNVKMNCLTPLQAVYYYKVHLLVPVLE